jgi:hypothetical protein
LAYSNRVGEERALVVYNNSFFHTRGTIHTSTEINTGSQDQAHLIRKSLGEALGLRYDSQHFYILHDHRTHLEQLFSGQQIAEKGLYVELNGYQYHTFLGFEEIRDSDGSWWKLFESLNGGSIPSIKDAYREMLLEPVLGSLRTPVGPLDRMEHARSGIDCGKDRTRKPNPNSTGSIKRRLTASRNRNSRGLGKTLSPFPNPFRGLRR